MSAAYQGAKGSVGILSVGAGDTTLSFDKSNPAERIRAGRIVRDMLRRGYALLIEVERNGVKAFERALDFDENVCQYVIADFDGGQAEAHDQQEGTRDQQEQTPPRDEEAGTAPRLKRTYTKRRVDAESTRAVAVARTAGG